MDTAYSLYNCVTYESDDSLLNYESYKELGLVCEKCSTPVFFRQEGRDGRKAHFAHFSGIESEGCELKMKSSTSIIKSNAVTERKNQTIQKFLEYFLNIFITINPDFYLGISTAKSQLKWLDHDMIFGSFFSNIPSPLDQLFARYREQLIKLRTCHEFQIKFSISLTPDKKLINFLCLESSRDLLSQLTYYTFYKFYKSSYSNKNDLEEWGEIYSIYLIKMIESTFTSYHQ